MSPAVPTTPMIIPDEAGDARIAGTSTYVSAVHFYRKVHLPSKAIARELHLTEQMVLAAIAYLDQHAAFFDARYQHEMQQFVHELLMILEGDHRTAWQDYTHYLVCGVLGGLFAAGGLAIVGTDGTGWLLVLLGSWFLAGSILFWYVDSKRCCCIHHGIIQTTDIRADRTWTLTEDEIARIDLGSWSSQLRWLVISSHTGRHYDVTCTRSMKRAIDRWLEASESS
jgi:hypothetical protein